MARKRQDSTVLYDDIVLQHVEWVYLSKELTGISVRAFQVLCFLQDYYSRSFLSRAHRPKQLSIDLL